MTGRDACFGPLICADPSRIQRAILDPTLPTTRLLRPERLPSSSLELIPFVLITWRDVVPGLRSHMALVPVLNTIIEEKVQPSCAMNARSCSMLPMNSPMSAAARRAS